MTEPTAMKWLLDMNQLRQTQELQSINNALESLVSVSQLESLKETQEQLRRSSLPKCPDCHEPIEAKTPTRCSSCTGQLVWITPYTATTAATYARGYDMSSELATDPLVKSLDTHISTIKASGDERLASAVKRKLKSVIEADICTKAFLAATAKKKNTALKTLASIRSWAKLIEWLVFGVCLATLGVMILASLRSSPTNPFAALVFFWLVGAVIYKLISLLRTFVLDNLLVHVLPLYATLRSQEVAFENFGEYLPVALDAVSRGELADNKSDGRPGWVSVQQADDYLAASRLTDLAMVWRQAVTLWLAPIGLRIDFLRRNKEAGGALSHDSLLERLRIAEDRNATPEDWLEVLPDIGLPSRLVIQGRRLLSWAVPTTPLKDALEAKFAKAWTDSAQAASFSEVPGESTISKLSTTHTEFALVIDLLAIPAVVNGKVSSQVLASAERELVQLGYPQAQARSDYMAACKRIHKEIPEKAVVRLAADLLNHRRTGKDSIDAAGTWKAIVSIGSQASGDKERTNRLLQDIRKAISAIKH